MELVLLTVCLSFSLPSFEMSDVRVYPVVEIEAELPGNRYYGFALPFIQVLEPDAPSWGRAHELQHHRQMRNLGFVSFGLAYLMGLGHGFEDYLGDGTMLDFPDYNPCGGYL